MTKDSGVNLFVHVAAQWLASGTHDDDDDDGGTVPYSASPFRFPALDNFAQIHRSDESVQHGPGRLPRGMQESTPAANGNQ